MEMLSRVGDFMNNWRTPLFNFGSNEHELQNLISRNEHLQNINPADFEENSRTTDEILRIVMQGIRRFAGEQFEGLVIHDQLIKFGSSREGLKVIDALEFDSILVFDINGLELEPVLGNTLGLVRLQVNNAEELLEKYPWIKKYGVFKQVFRNKYLINSRNLHLKVFESIIDKTRELVNEMLRDTEYSFDRIAKPPTINIRILLNKEKGIPDLYDKLSIITLQSESLEAKEFKPSLDIDIVPALLIRNDSVPDPNARGAKMPCPVYAVMKWVNLSQDTEMAMYKDFLWRVCTSGYERHILDVCQTNTSQQFLITACRILKTYVSNQDGTNQIHKVATSYHLKTICFHCITLLTIPKDHNSLSGVKEALGYFLSFLNLCINSATLPHFFHGNPCLVLMFPECSFGEEEHIKNVYGSMSSETFHQAKISYNKMLRDLLGLYTDNALLDDNRLDRFAKLLDLQHTVRKPKDAYKL
ncbi:Hypothetical predicted protein [Mytilus galloprovincialis]|uniref:Mab-21-like HhH/H2TH-like domain-containing protein n=1 Tax=Mytilus galloprovincialis TaxID=29158 RepID=A0A8B6F369_MYTGA|nr:Hypothetical predicted protein [Mytilus galloprovincialis]